MAGDEIAPHPVLFCADAMHRLEGLVLTASRNFWEKAHQHFHQV